MVRKVIGTLFGLAIMIFAVMAFFSGEPASKTDFGRIITLVVFVFGFSIAVGNLSSKNPVTQTPPTPIIPVTPNCPSCGKTVAAEFAVCPYCATVLKPKCPHCGKEVAHDYKNCPYCGTQL